eukprot:1158839-Pelagomonas_calceolata.AAC.4
MSYELQYAAKFTLPVCGHTNYPWPAAAAFDHNSLGAARFLSSPSPHATHAQHLKDAVEKVVSIKAEKDIEKEVMIDAMQLEMDAPGSGKASTDCKQLAEVKSKVQQAGAQR